MAIGSVWYNSENSRYYKSCNSCSLNKWQGVPKMYLEYSKRHYKYNYIGGRISRFEAMRAKVAHIPSDEERVKAKRM